MQLLSRIPEYVSTELGRASVGVCRPENATKRYKCPFCDEHTHIGEQHVVVTPDVMFRLRRHMHTDCLETAMEYGIDIKLHPEGFDVVRHYFGGG